MAGYLFFIFECVMAILACYFLYRGYGGKKINFTKWFNKQKLNQPPRAHVKNVQPGQTIRIEWSKISGDIGWIKCLSNDPITKKILLEIEWGNYEEINCEKIQQIVFDYDDKELRNFNLLNQHLLLNIEPTERPTDITSLHKLINEALEKEQYEKAAELQKQIDALLKK